MLSSGQRLSVNRKMEGWMSRTEPWPLSVDGWTDSIFLPVKRWVLPTDASLPSQVSECYRMEPARMVQIQSSSPVPRESGWLPMWDYFGTAKALLTEMLPCAEAATVTVFLSFKKTH